MPENDDLFSTYKDQGLPVNPLPAAEVRRRGDRLRRRNTALATIGGIAAVGVLVGTPLAVVAGGDAGPPDRFGPAATPSTGVVEWRTEVPAEFPLLSGMPEGAARVAALEPPVMGPCNTAGFAAAGALDADVARWTDGVEASEQRLVAVYDDDRAAGQVIEELRAGLADCQEPPSGGGVRALEVDTDLGEQSLTVVHQFWSDGAPTGEADIQQLVRVGNALLLDQAGFGGGGDPAVVDRTVGQVREGSAHAVAALCLFAADPCAEVPAEPEAPAAEADGSTTGIPASFPLDAGLTADSDAEALGPARDIDGVDLSALCGAGRSVWPASPAERLAYALAGPEFLQVRELATYPSVDRATEVLAQVRDAVASCSVTGSNQGTDLVWTVLDEQVDGDGDAVTFASTRADGGLGGVVYRLHRVGNAVFATSRGGEWTTSTVVPGARELVDGDADVVAAMTARYGG